ncbi:MAG: ribose transport system ATP-binding protein [Thermomicrobiales bacterium]|nr:ribose transport system ATP-binding protein [Thermomicrobiales bacterium]
MTGPATATVPIPPTPVLGPAVALEMRGIRKAFPGVQALDGVDLVLRHGEIHALVGENGAGKSTLLKIVTGVYRQDEGVVRVDGQEVRFASPRDALRAGIAVVHQERNLIPKFSVAENITLEQPPVRAGQLVDQTRMVDEARRWLGVLRLRLDPLAPVERLSVAQMQLVEIAKALSLQNRILLLDEPTASITPHETAILFDVLRRLRDDGAAILFVSHKLEEIFALCDRVTVLRDGRLATFDADLREFDRDSLVTRMIGRAEQIHEFAARPVDRSRPVLEVRGLNATTGSRDVSFALAPGEVLGLYGLVGAGRSELARVLVGVGKVTGGEIRIDGRPVRIRDAREALERYRIGYVSENRQGEGLILAHSVQANVAVTVWQRLKNIVGWVSGRQERATVAPFVEQLRVKTPSLSQTVGNLSGGNQQKVSLAKWLAAKTRVLIIDEPTVGIDVKTKHELHELIWELASQGLAILLISSDMPEMVRLADRILVMKGHRIVGEVANTHRYDEVSEAIMRHIHADDGRATRESGAVPVAGDVPHGS